VWNISRDRYARPFGRRRAPRATARLLRALRATLSRLRSIAACHHNCTTAGKLPADLTVRCSRAACAREGFGARVWFKANRL
jgi:hypothetical protein